MKSRKQDRIKDSRPLTVLAKSQLGAWLSTGAALLLLALLYYKLRFSEQIVGIIITAVYALCSILAGFLSGKGLQDKRFLWGLVSGTAYFVILLLISLLARHGLKDIGTHFFTTMMVCCFGGMLGGMIS